jgi:hypothetical protein
MVGGDFYYSILYNGERELGEGKEFSLTFPGERIWFLEGNDILQPHTF